MIRDSGFGFRDSGFGIWIRDSGCGMQDSGFGIRVSGFEFFGKLGKRRDAREHVREEGLPHVGHPLCHRLPGAQVGPHHPPS